MLRAPAAGPAELAIANYPAHPDAGPTELAIANYPAPTVECKISTKKGETEMR